MGGIAFGKPEREWLRWCEDDVVETREVYDFDGEKREERREVEGKKPGERREKISRAAARVS